MSRAIGKARPARGSALAVAVTAVTVSLALVGTAAAVDAQTTERFHWSGELAPGQTLAVDGLTGGIRAAPASGRQVEVMATKRTDRGGRAGLAEVEVQVLEHADGITVCAVYPGSRGGGVDRCPTGRRGHRGSTDVSVEFEVRVPSGVRFSAKTVNGGIEARDLDGDVALGTVNGSIEVSTFGGASAETVNGAIRATIGRLDDETGLSFQTVNGSVQVTLPAEADARVVLEAVNGELRSDFPLTIPAGSRIGSRGPALRRLEGAIGNGGPSLELRTVNGTIELRRRD